MELKRVFVIDGSPAIRGKLCKQLSHCGYLAEPFAEIEEVGGIWPSAAILFIRDERNRIADAVEFLRLKKKMYPIVAYAEAPTARNVVSALRLGAIDYLKFPFLPSEIKVCISDITKIWGPIEQEWSSAVKADGKIATLSHREFEILSFLEAGHSANKDIAQELGISPRTVEIHRANLFKKLEVKSGIEAVLISKKSVMSTSAPIAWSIKDSDINSISGEIRQIGKREGAKKS